MPSKEGKTYRGIVTLGNKRAAQRRGFKTRKEARKWEDETRKKLLAPPPAEADTDFKEFCNQYLDMCKVKYGEKTFVEKRACLKSFVTFLRVFFGCDPTFGHITKKAVSDYLLRKAEMVSGNAANKDRKNLLALFNWGRDISSLSFPPMIGCFPHDREPQYTPPEKDVLKVLACASGEIRVMLMCYVCTGARLNEVLKLRWADVNFEKEEIRLWTKKTRDGSISGEWLPMNQELHQALWWQWENRTDKVAPWAFPNPETGEPYQNKRWMFRSLCKTAGVKYFTAHAVRRFFADMLADKYKQSTKIVQRFLRHKNVRTTEIYLENINHDLKAVSDLIVFEGGKTEGEDREDAPEISKGG